MQILLVHPKAEIRELLCFPLESKFSAQVKELSTAEEAIAFLQKPEEKIDFLVLDNQQDMLKKMVQAVQRKFPQPYVVLCDPDPLKNPVKLAGCNVLGAARYDHLLEDVVSLLGEAALEKQSEEGYTRIRTEILTKMSPLDAGVFVRLSAKHFVKLFHKGSNFGKDDLEKYGQRKKLTHLFLPNDDTKFFIERFQTMLQTLLAKEKITMAEAGTALEESVDTVQELVHKFGVTPEVQKAVKTSVAVAMKALGDFPQLGDAMKEMNANKDKYVAAHSLMLAHVACSMAVAVDWYSDATFEKLTLAAFLHDIALRDNQLCAVKSQQELVARAGEFSPKKIEDYRAHPERAAELVAKFPETHADVAQIVVQHQELPDGSGFPAKLNAAAIAPLASLFIIAHDFTDFALEKGGQAKMKDFLAAFDAKYSQGNFKKIAKAIASIEI